MLVTDHKPLVSLFGPKKAIPPLAAARLQRWAITLSAYSYEIEYKPTKLHANADSLSRLPLPSTETSEDLVNVFNVAQVEALPVTSLQVAAATSIESSFPLHPVWLAGRGTRSIVTLLESQI